MEFEIHRIATPTANAYLLKFGKIAALVDTLAGTSQRSLQRAFARLEFDPAGLCFILLTHYHYDHTGNAARLKEISGAKVVCGEGDVDYVEGVRKPPGPSRISVAGRLLSAVPPSVFEKYQSFAPVGVDIAVSDGFILNELGIEVMEVPGHTPGGICYFDRDRSFAFTGDIVSNIFGRCGLPFLSFSESLEDILGSIERLASLGSDVAYPGHGRPIRPNASEKISDLAQPERRKLHRA